MAFTALRSSGKEKPRKRSGRAWADPIVRMQQAEEARRERLAKKRKKPTRADVWKEPMARIERAATNAFRVPETMMVNANGYAINATSLTVTPITNNYANFVEYGTGGTYPYQQISYTPTSYQVTVQGTYFDAGTNRVYETPPPWQYVGTSGNIPFSGSWQNVTIEQHIGEPPVYTLEGYIDGNMSEEQMRALYGYADGRQWNEINAPLAPITQEEADRRLRETRARAFKQQIERTRAVRKGRRLLLVTMTEMQQRDYAKTGTFMVLAANGKWYRLRKNGTTHELGADGVATHSHCIHLSHSFISEDTLIAVKMLLETDPAEFHRIANTTPLSTARAPRIAARIAGSMNANPNPIYALAG